MLNNPPNKVNTMIALMPHAISHPIEISEDEYAQLVRLKQYGWSVCQTEREWLVKLHYLRQGLKEGKIDETTFQQRETALVLNWLRKDI